MAKAKANTIAKQEYERDYFLNSVRLERGYWEDPVSRILVAKGASKPVAGEML